MRWAIIAAAVLLGACASTAPPALSAIKDDVDSRVTYVRYFAKDYRDIPSPERTEGNCAVFAATYQGEAKRRGIDGDIRVCRLTNGDGHAFFETKDGRVLDVRQRFVGTREDVGCAQ